MTVTMVRGLNGNRAFHILESSEPGNYTLSFTPTKGAGVEKFATGVNTVKVIYWKITEGRRFAKPSFTWQFDVV